MIVIKMHGGLKEWMETSCKMQVEQQQQVVMRKQEQAVAAREALQQLKGAPEPTQQIAHLILQQNQPLYLAWVLQVTSTLGSVYHTGTAHDTICSPNVC